MTNSATELSISKPHFLYAKGDADRLEVLRSHWIASDHVMSAPSRGHVAAHSLVLVARESFQLAHFMWGGADAEVFVKPEVRNCGVVEIVVTTDELADLSADALERTALQGVEAAWPLPDRPSSGT